jgi:hypothetical protein
MSIYERNADHFLIEPSRSTLRLWSFVNGSWVKLSLRPGRCLTWRACCATDEGYHSEYEVWEHVGNGVQWDYGTDSRDCDGPHSTQCARFAMANELALEEPWAKEDRAARIMLPKWRKIGRDTQRDVFAEAAGY